MKHYLLSLNILHVFNDGFLASFLLLLPFIAKDLHLSLTSVGVLGGIISLSSILLALVSSSLAARFGGMRTVLLAMAVYGTGYLMTGIAPTYFFLLLTFFFTSLGFGVFHSIAMALISKWSSKETRGKALGNFTAIGDLGRVGIAAGLTFLITFFGWRVSTLFYGVIAFVVCLLVYLYFGKQADTQVEEKKKQHGHIDLRLLFRNKLLFFATLTTMFDSLASNSIFVFLPFLLLKRGISPTLLGSFTGAFFIGNFIGKVLLGRFADRFSSTKIFMVADICMALCIVILTTLSSPVLIVIISIILGALTRGTVPVTASFVADSVTEGESHEQAFALAYFGDNIAITFAPIILGFVSDHFGIVIAFYLSAVFALCAVIPALGFAVSRKK